MAAAVNNSTRAPLSDGTTPLEVFSLTFPVPLCSLFIWLFAEIFNAQKLLQYLEIYGLNVILLLSLTLLCNRLHLLFCCFGILIILLLCILTAKHFTFKQLKSTLKSFSISSIPANNMDRTFVMSYRGHLLMATSICILAVDFNFFPLRFAKTETYGWSIMDAGVGSFVLVHGLCSSHAKNLAEKATKVILKKHFLSSLPLFALGFIRLAVITAVGYHKVVPEYGIHWNFFFTLAFTKLICPIVLNATGTKNCGTLAATVAIIHQFLLSKMDLTSLVLSDSRDTFLEANKEGICSLLGFITLYFCGVRIGHLIWKKRQKTNEYFKLLLQLCAVGICGWILMHYAQEAVQPVSRRMANLSYCIWVVSLTSLQMGLHLLQELVILVLCKVFKGNSDSFLLWKAINFNGLLYFLLANLITGIVNLTIDTVETRNVNAFAIMNFYLAILTAASVIAYKKSRQFKFW